MSRNRQPYWIKERHNPQLGVYYVACGPMPTKEARKREDALYGDNFMLRFNTRSEYLAKLSALREAGEKVQGS